MLPRSNKSCDQWRVENSVQKNAHSIIARARNTGADTAVASNIAAARVGRGARVVTP